MNTISYYYTILHDDMPLSYSLQYNFMHTYRTFRLSNTHDNSYTYAFFPSTFVVGFYFSLALGPY